MFVACIWMGRETTREGRICNTSYYDTRPYLEYTTLLLLLLLFWCVFFHQQTTSGIGRFGLHHLDLLHTTYIFEAPYSNRILDCTTC
jgi:hypothetical protein